jgi:chromosome partitioning protein
VAIIGLVQSKGGVGKTTSAINLAAELARRGRSVVVVDADPARHATGIAADGRLPFRVETMLCEDVDAVAAWAKGVRAIKADFIIVDAPGAMGAAFGASIAICDLALIPSGATVLDVRGAAETVKLIRQHRRASGRTKPDVLILPSRIDKRTVAGKGAVATLAILLEAVSAAISYRAIVADSLASGEPVAADSPSAAEFAALADAVLTRLGD